MILRVLSSGPGEPAQFPSTLTMSRGGRETLATASDAEVKALKKVELSQGTWTHGVEARR